MKIRSQSPDARGGDRDLRVARYFNIASLGLKILCEKALMGNDLAVNELARIADEILRRASQQDPREPPS